MSIDAGHPGISWALQFRALIDGSLLRLRSPEGIGWDLFIRAGALFLEDRPPPCPSLSTWRTPRT